MRIILLNMIIQVFLLFLSSGTYASVLNSICEKAQIAIVKTPQETNLCLIPTVDLTENEKRTLDQLSSLNERTATLFNTTLPELFSGEKLQIGLEPHFFSAMASMAIGPIILMGVPYNWYDGLVNESIYLHELGHTIVSLKSQKLPEAFKFLDNSSSLFVEMIADLIALSLTNRIISPEESLPSCFMDLRSFDENTSYYLPESFFTIESTKKILLCCQEIADDNNPKLEYVKKECSGLKAEERLLAFGQLPETELTENSKYDPHQIGLPIQAFLKSLSYELKLPFRSVVTTFLNSKISEEKYFKVDCTQVDSEKESGFYSLDVWTMEHLFNAYRKSLNDYEKEKYDLLWKKHGMKMINKISRKDAISAAKSRVFYSQGKNLCRISTGH